MFTEEVKVNRFTEQVNKFRTFIQEGAGSVVTHEDDKGGTRRWIESQHGVCFRRWDGLSGK